MSDELKSTGEVLREAIYHWLEKEFKTIEQTLMPEAQIDLDGILWKLSGTLANAGLWEALQRISGIEVERSSMHTSFNCPVCGTERCRIPEMRT